MRVSRRNNGFSFVEILISIVLVGLSITALVFASNSFTMANGAGADLSTAEFLIEQIRELTTLLPVDANRNALNALAAFSQTVKVENVSQSDFNTVVGPHASNFVRITVSVSLAGREISSASWIRARL